MPHYSYEPAVYAPFIARLSRPAPQFTNLIDNSKHETLAAAEAAVRAHLVSIGGVYNAAAKRNYTLTEVQNLVE